MAMTIICWVNIVDGTWIQAIWVYPKHLSLAVAHVLLHHHWVVCWQRISIHAHRNASIGDTAHFLRNREIDPLCWSEIYGCTGVWWREHWILSPREKARMWHMHHRMVRHKGIHHMGREHWSHMSWGTCINAVGINILIGMSIAVAITASIVIIIRSANFYRWSIFLTGNWNWHSTSFI